MPREGSGITYDASVDGHLKRCKERRGLGSYQDLVYAALELRIGVEARLAEAVQAASSLTPAQRRQWKVVHLAKTLEAIKWSKGDDILVGVIHVSDPDEVFEIHYFPVTKRLIEIVGRLGEHLHRNEHVAADPVGAHRELSALVKEGYGDLFTANSGELLGHPQINPLTNSVDLILKFSGGDPRGFTLQQALASKRQRRIDWFTITPIGRPTFYENDVQASAATSLPPLPVTALGRYRHYTGGEYEVIGVARHSETHAPMIVYRPMYNATGWWVRPHAMFFEAVVVDGVRRTRFEKVG